MPCDQPENVFGFAIPLHRARGVEVVSICGVPRSIEQNTPAQLCGVDKHGSEAFENVAARCRVVGLCGVGGVKVVGGIAVPEADERSSRGDRGGEYSEAQAFREVAAGISGAVFSVVCLGRERSSSARRETRR